MKLLHIVFPIFIPLLFLSVPAHAEVMFYDIICLKDETVMLKAQTGGRVFGKGGELVEFVIDGKSMGKVLSGGDGFAFKEFTPKKTGMYKISVISGKDKNSGFLLAVEKGTRIVFIDVEGSIFAPFSNEPKRDSQKVIKLISKKSPVIYLKTGIFDIKTIKKWLNENGFADAPLLSWREGVIFDEIVKKGLKIKFIIGGASVIESAKEFKPKAFSFEEVEGAEEVKDWEEIGKKIKLVIK